MIDNKKEINKEEQLDQLLESKNNKFWYDKENKSLKGDQNKDVRFNPNMNRKEVDEVTSENQLR